MRSVRLLMNERIKAVAQSLPRINSSTLLSFVCNRYIPAVLFIGHEDLKSGWGAKYFEISLRPVLKFECLGQS